jgi:DNA-binding HxlR family transcriptional regulator
MQAMKRPRRSDCPVHYALNAFGDAWTLLIIRDLMFKNRSTYSELLAGEERIATNILADRLSRLERDDIVAHDGQRYRLTRKGVDLAPVMVELIAWSAKHDPKTAADARFVRRARTDRRRLLDEIRSHLKETTP